MDLAQVGLALDQEEKNAMAEMGMETKEFLQFVAEDSSNVALDGNFSIQVLRKALQMMNLSSLPIGHPDLKAAKVQEEPQNQTGFMCNLRSHWFAIRKIENSWWDLNSTHNAPVFLSPLYLGAFLKQLQVEGYSIFVIRGEYPRPMQDGGMSWVRVTPGVPGTKAPANPWGGQAQSLGHGRGGHDADLEAAIRASLAGQTRPQHQGSFGSESDEIALAIALSMQDAKREPSRPLPPEPQNKEGINLQIRLPDGSRIGRRFSLENYLEDIWNWVLITKQIDLSSPKNTLVSFDRQQYRDPSKTLASLEFKGNVALTVEQV